MNTVAKDQPTDFKRIDYEDQGRKLHVLKTEPAAPVIEALNIIKTQGQLAIEAL